jgi:hypothetical protein
MLDDCTEKKYAIIRWDDGVYQRIDMETVAFMGTAEVSAAKVVGFDLSKEAAIAVLKICGQTDKSYTFSNIPLEK